MKALILAAAVIVESKGVVLEQKTLTIYAPPQADDYENDGTREQARYEAAQRAEALASKHNQEQEKIDLANVKKMQHEFLLFSKSLEEKHFESAQKLKEKVENSNIIPKEQINSLSKVSTGELYLQAFKFPDVARHEYAQQQLDEVEIAEKNLNNNIDNEDLLTSFTKTAQKIKKSLQEKYGDSWVDPSNVTEEDGEQTKSQIKDEDVDIDV